MEAYAALDSLMHTIELIEHLPDSRYPISLDKNQVKSVAENVTFLQEFLNDYSFGYFAKEVYSFERRIKDVADAANHKIQSLTAAEIADKSTSHAKNKLDEPLQKVLDDMNLIMKEAMEIKQKIAPAKQIESIRDLEADRSTLVDQSFGKFTSHGEKKSYEHLQEVVKQVSITRNSMEILGDISGAVKQKESALYDDLIRRLVSEENFPPRDESLAHSEVRSILPPEVVCGRDHDKKILLSKLIHAGVQLLVTPIVGSCGIGKTTVARMVYEERSVREHFELRVWVKVEEREFNLKHAAHGILESAMGMRCSLDDLEELDEMVRDTLQSHRCLIVFDGVDSMSKDSWLHMNQRWFDFLDFGSNVVITTPSTDVAKIVSKQSFELKQLSSIDCWSLLNCIAFDSSSVKDNIMLRKAENHVSCQGIPLLLKLCGSLIRFDHRMIDLVLANDSLGSATIILYCILALPWHLSRCLAYCAVFPKGYVLSKVKIIDMWIADGLIKPSLEYMINNNLVDIGDAYFHQLMSRSFFTDITRDQYDDVISFLIPSLIRKMMKGLAGTFYKGKLGLIGSVGEDATQFSLVSPGKHESDHMRTVIMSPTLYLGCSLDHSSFLDFLELRSLDLSYSGIKNLSDDVRVLRELRYLNLSYTFIERLPDSITDLSSLQTLDLSWCYHLKDLPKGLGGLMLMSHLDLSWCESLSSFPSGIGSLTNLSSMPLFVLGKGHDCAGLGELGLLNQLQGKLEIRNLENVKENREAQDAKLYNKRLQHLELSWSQNGDDCFEVLELLKPNQELKVLNLRGYNSSRFPRWISCINSLVKVSITDCGCEKLPSLGQLPFLKELELKGMPRLERIGEEFYGDGTADVVFQSLEQVELHDMPRLLKWSGASAINAFPSLKSLTIEGCSQLGRLPSFHTLTDLIVLNSNEIIFFSWTGFESLLSLLLNDVKFMWLSQDAFYTLKKLILHNVEDRFLVFDWGPGRMMWTALEHLGILHCNNLKYVCFGNLYLLKKLHIVNCQDLDEIWMLTTEDAPLMELVIEDCPQLEYVKISFPKLHSLRKMVVRNCSKLTIDLDNFVKQEKLEYLSISGCPRLEMELEKISELMSHIPCIIVGNHKANYKESWSTPQFTTKGPLFLGPPFPTDHKSTTRLRNPRGGDQANRAFDLDQEVLIQNHGLKGEKMMGEKLQLWRR